MKPQRKDFDVKKKTPKTTKQLEKTNSKLDPVDKSTTVNSNLQRSVDFSSSH